MHPYLQYTARTPPFLHPLPQKALHMSPEAPMVTLTLTLKDSLIG